MGNVDDIHVLVSACPDPGQKAVIIIVKFSGVSIKLLVKNDHRKVIFVIRKIYICPRKIMQMLLSAVEPVSGNYPTSYANCWFRRS